MKIIFSIASGLGDTLFFAPAFFGLKELYPDAEFTILVPRLFYNRALLEKVLKVDKIIHLKRLRSFKPKAIFSYFNFLTRLIRDIRKEKYDIFICTVQARLLDQYFLLMASGANLKVGPEFWRGKKNPFRFLLNTKITAKKKHICQEHFDIVRSLKKSEHLPIEPYLDKLNKKLRQHARPSQNTFDFEKVIIILPGSGTQPYKRWPLKRFLSAIDYLLEKFDYDVIMLGGKMEYDSSLIPDGVNSSAKFHNIGSSLNINEIIELFTKAKLVLGNDNGLLHLAEFLKIPSIGIYPTNWKYVSGKYLYNEIVHDVLPAKEQDDLIRYLELNSFRFRSFQKKCNEVVTSISVEAVIDKIEAQLSNEATY